MNKVTARKGTAAWIVVLAVAVAILPLVQLAHGKTTDETAIRARIDALMAAIHAKDANKIMSFYAPGDELLAFDVIPPRQYVGWTAYEKDWQGFLDMFDGPVDFDRTELKITASGNLAYSHSIDHVSGKLKDGSPIEVVLRVTDVFRRIKGQWLVVHEHVSVPVDLATGKADLLSKP